MRQGRKDLQKPVGSASPSSIAIWPSCPQACMLAGMLTVVRSQRSSALDDRQGIHIAAKSDRGSLTAVVENTPATLLSMRRRSSMTGQRSCRCRIRYSLVLGRCKFQLRDLVQVPAKSAGCVANITSLLCAYSSGKPRPIYNENNCRY